MGHYPDDPADHEPDDRSFWQRFRDWWMRDDDRMAQVSADVEAIRASVGMSNTYAEKTLRKIDNFKEMVMSAVDDLKSALDEATDGIAARIDRILSGQDAALVAALQPELDRLRALGKDPENPAPPVPPVDDPSEPATPVEDSGDDESV